MKKKALFFMLTTFPLLRAYHDDTVRIEIRNSYDTSSNVMRILADRFFNEDIQNIIVHGIGSMAAMSPQTVVYEYRDYKEQQTLHCTYSTDMASSIIEQVKTVVVQVRSEQSGAPCIE